MIFLLSQSLSLAILPMFITFFLCMILGVYMAANQNSFKDLALNVIFLILYAIPVFVVGPFLIEKVALNHTFFFTDSAIPLGGFNSPDQEFKMMTSLERLWDILKHLALPLCAIMYGGLAAQTRIARTAVLEVLRQNYVRTAQAKGLSRFYILFKHVGRNASITIVTSVAGSLGVIIGGSLIIETIFGINGFGKFFYEAILNYDYNVIMFSVIVGSFLTLLGYLVADVCYTLLDPRVTLD
ncbi:Dipeptide transport system permease protein DppB [Chlamydiales bacterium SCGC AB-751-O23]|nr:Dipeptide transport system permease protein DppB [Chlamydiales bacterium SCGC AB-751-O23]